jgi:hypothetical protein
VVIDEVFRCVDEALLSVVAGLVNGDGEHQQWGGVEHGGSFERRCGSDGFVDAARERASAAAAAGLLN